jgi:hypothetical protein
MTSTIPAGWMPDAAMKRIHIHWTAGAYNAGTKDKASYHILVESDGTLVRGDKPIDANAAGSGKTPASHTKNANTGAIGVSLCCMAGAKEKPFDAGSKPMKAEQWEAMIAVVAQLARRYSIAVTPTSILTHAEVQPNLSILQDGKWDITHLPFEPGTVGYKAVGDKMRLAVAVALDAMDGAVKAASAKPAPLPASMKLPRFKVTGVAPSTLNFRNGPGGEKVGELPEGVVVERLALFDIWSQVRTPAGYVGWVSTAFLKAL